MIAFMNWISCLWGKVDEVLKNQYQIQGEKNHEGEDTRLGGQIQDSQHVNNRNCRMRQKAEGEKNNNRRMFTLVEGKSETTNCNVQWVVGRNEFFKKSTVFFLIKILHSKDEKQASRHKEGEGNGTPLQYSCLENPMDGGAWWAAVHGVAISWTWLSDFTFTFHFHALEKEMATHSSVFAWRLPGTGEPGGLLSVGLHRVRHDWSDFSAAAGIMRQGILGEEASDCLSASQFTMRKGIYVKNFIPFQFITHPSPGGRREQTQQGSRGSFIQVSGLRKMLEEGL